MIWGAVWLIHVEVSDADSACGPVASPGMVTTTFEALASAWRGGCIQFQEMRR